MSVGTSGETSVGVSSASGDMLKLDNVTSGYGKFVVLRNVDLTVQPGQVVALLGANGAGKTTLLRTAAGLLKPGKGQVCVHGTDMTRRGAADREQAGLCLIPEGRGVFKNLTVLENLRLFIRGRGDDPALDRAFEAFPILASRRRQRAGTLSGGEQQMLALSRAIVTKPSVVLVDEVSMGLAPLIVDRIFEALQGLARQGTALLLVEQYVERALAMADLVYTIKRGTVMRAGAPAELDTSALIAEYLGSEADPQHEAPEELNSKKKDG
jgi:branched-chain amino acid transport system ATP-binding protein